MYRQSKEFESVCDKALHLATKSFDPKILNHDALIIATSIDKSEVMKLDGWDSDQELWTVTSASGKIFHVQEGTIADACETTGFAYLLFGIPYSIIKQAGDKTIEDAIRRKQRFLAAGGDLP